MSDQYGAPGDQGRHHDQGHQQWQGQPQQHGEQQWPGQPQQQWGQQPQQQWQGQPQQQWGQPGPQQWQGQQPQHPGQPGGPAGWYPGAPQQQPRKRRLGVIITAVVVVLALAAGVTVWLVSRKGTETAYAGQATPQAAASEMFSALARKDVVAVSQQLDPSEAQVFSDISGDMIGELKRLGILDSSATVGNATGTTITVQGLTFDDKAEEKVNDHVSIVKLTGGTISITSDPGSIPLSDKVKQLLGGQLAAAKKDTVSVDIAQRVKERGMPIRIATVKRGDTWYPSLFYTLADYWFQKEAAEKPALKDPSLATAISPIGAGSPEQAVQQLVEKAMAGDYEGVIGMLPPDEMGVLYDYGKRLLAASTPGKVTSQAQLSDLQLTSTDVTGGKKVMLRSLTVTAEGKTYQVAIDQGAGTMTVTQDGRSMTLTADTVLQQVMGGSRAQSVPPQVQDIVKRVWGAALQLGAVTVQVDGKWYVSPLRSYSGIVLTFLKALQPSDIDYLVQLARQSQN